jgi:hypothetical protein
MNPGGNPGYISIPMVITNLEEIHVLDAGTAGSEHDLDDSEERLTSNSPVVPLISLNEADLHLTALLSLLETITVTEFRDMCSVSFPDSVVTGLRFHNRENKKHSNLFNWLANEH